MIRYGIACLFITGCQTNPVTVPVKVPVPVKCTVAEPNRPVMPTDSLAVDDSLDRKAAALVAEIIVREAYEDELRTAVRACKQ